MNFSLASVNFIAQIASIMIITRATQLQIIEQETDYNDKYKEFQDVNNALMNTRNSFEKATLDFQVALERYQAFQERWIHLRWAIAQCCYEEFDELVEVTLPPRPV